MVGGNLGSMSESIVYVGFGECDVDVIIMVYWFLGRV